MIRSMNFPITKECVLPYGGWDGLAEQLRLLPLDGVEGIADPDYYDESFPSSLLTGYHMTFYPDWVDFWRQDRAALIRKFGSMETARGFYRCSSPDDYLGMFRADLALARRLGAKYLVFHVSDVSIEEGYTYRWEHTDREVTDAALELINAVLEGAGEDPSFDFLVENQWWPGFTFTDPRETEYLLSRIRYPRVGIMLDTGHLMHTNTKLRTQGESLAYVHRMLDLHGALCGAIRGVHLNQSLTGALMRRYMREPPEMKPTYAERNWQVFEYVFRIDRHRPFTCPGVKELIERIAPEYLTFEFISNDEREHRRMLRAQRRALA